MDFTEWAQGATPEEIVRQYRATNPDMSTLDIMARFKADLAQAQQTRAMEMLRARAAEPAGAGLQRIWSQIVANPAAWAAGKLVSGATGAAGPSAQRQAEEAGAGLSRFVVPQTPLQGVLAGGGAMLSGMMPAAQGIGQALKQAAARMGLMGLLGAGVSGAEGGNMAAGAALGAAGQGIGELAGAIPTAARLWKRSTAGVGGDVQNRAARELFGGPVADAIERATGIPFTAETAGRRLAAIKEAFLGDEARSAVGRQIHAIEEGVRSAAPGLTINMPADFLPIRTAQGADLTGAFPGGTIQVPLGEALDLRRTMAREARLAPSDAAGFDARARSRAMNDLVTDAMEQWAQGQGDLWRNAVGQYGKTMRLKSAIASDPDVFPVTTEGGPGIDMAKWADLQNRQPGKVPPELARVIQFGQPFGTGAVAANEPSTNLRIFERVPLLPVGLSGRVGGSAGQRITYPGGVVPGAPPPSAWEAVARQGAAVPGMATLGQLMPLGLQEVEPRPSP